MLPFLDARRCLAALVHARALGFRFLYDKQKSAKRRPDEFSLYTLIVTVELITYLSEFTIKRLCCCMWGSVPVATSVPRAGNEAIGFRNN